MAKNDSILLDGIIDQRLVDGIPSTPTLAKASSISSAALPRRGHPQPIHRLPVSLKIKTGRLSKWASSSSVSLSID
jgi:hypothetical protein